MHFQQYLRREREIRGWSQARMAHELGTTPNTISAWERGISLPSPYFRAKLYELLGKNAVELGLLGECTTSNDVAIEQRSDAEQEIPGVERVCAISSCENAQSVQEMPELEAMTRAVPIQSKQQETASQVLVHNTAMSHDERKMLQSWLFTRRHLLLVAVVCMSLLSIVGGTTLLVLSHVLTPSDPYALHKGSLTLNEALTEQNPRVNWQEGWNANQASCQFEQGMYYAFQPRLGYFHACVAQLTDFSKFAYEVEMVLLHGDYGGIIFRAVDSIDSHYYLFRVSKDGSYTLKRYIDGTDNDAIVMATGFSQAYHAGYGQKNRLAVVADGDLLTLYINETMLITVSDAAYAHGQIGVIAGSEQQAPAEAAFSNAKVWTW
jgi:transcriptional regulator with XRE-family HTH domain